MNNTTKKCDCGKSGTSVYCNNYTPECWYKEQNTNYFSVDMPNHEAEAFGEFLLMDYEIDSFDNGELCWKLCGTNQKYTSKDLFKEFKDIYRNQKGVLTIN